MKKFFLSFLFIGVFAMYALYQFFGNSSQIAAVNPIASNQPSSAPQTNVLPQTQPLPTPISTPVSTPVATPVSTPPPTPSAVPPPAPKPTGQYADGTYTGIAADAYYGTIQVQAVIQGGKLADVVFLQHPSDRSTSIRINTAAMPILKSEAIQAQSANVDIVSGATDSSQAFEQSLGSALVKAKA